MGQVTAGIGLAIALAVIFAGVRPAEAQSLEQDYAARCADAARANDDTCQALGRALMAKLAQQHAPAGHAHAAGTPAPAGADPGPPFLPALLDAEYWYAPGHLLRFSRSGPAQMSIEDVLAGQTGTLDWSQGGAGFADAAGHWTASMLDDGYTLAKADGTEHRSFQLRADGQVLTLRTRIEWDGRWSELDPVEYRPMTPEEVALAARETAQAQSPGALQRHWGILADRAGRSFVFDQRWVDGQYVDAWHWERPGLVLTLTKAEVAERRVVRAPRWWATYRYDPLLRRVVGQGVAVQADGSLLYDYGDKRMLARSERGGGYAETTEHLVGGRWKTHVTLRFHPVEGDLAQTLATLTAARSAPSNSGLFGALVGAALGAYAGSAAGLDASQTAGLMVQGAAAAGGRGDIASAFSRGWSEETTRQDDMRQILQSGGQGTTGDTRQGAQGAVSGLQVSAPDAPAVPTGPTVAPRTEVARYAYCVAQAGCDEGRSCKAVLYLSAVAQVGAQTPGETERMAADFRAAVPASTPGRVRAPICMIDNDPVRAQQHLDRIPDRYPGWEIVRTGIAPRP